MEYRVCLGLSKRSNWTSFPIFSLDKKTSFCIEVTQCHFCRFNCDSLCNSYVVLQLPIQKTFIGPLLPLVYSDCFFIAERRIFHQNTSNTIHALNFELEIRHCVKPSNYPSLDIILFKDGLQCLMITIYHEWF